MLQPSLSVQSSRSERENNFFYSFENWLFKAYQVMQGHKPILFSQLMRSDQSAPVYSDKARGYLIRGKNLQRAMKLPDNDTKACLTLLVIACEMDGTTHLKTQEGEVAIDEIAKRVGLTLWRQEKSVPDEAKDIPVRWLQVFRQKNHKATSEDYQHYRHEQEGPVTKIFQQNLEGSLLAPVERTLESIPIVCETACALCNLSSRVDRVMEEPGRTEHKASFDDKQKETQRQVQAGFALAKKQPGLIDWHHGTIGGRKASEVAREISEFDERKQLLASIFPIFRPLYRVWYWGKERVIISRLRKLRNTYDRFREKRHQKSPVMNDLSDSIPGRQDLAQEAQKQLQTESPGITTVDALINALHQKNSLGEQVVLIEIFFRKNPTLVLNLQQWVIISMELVKCYPSYDEENSPVRLDTMKSRLKMLLVGRCPDELSVLWDDFFEGPGKMQRVLQQHMFSLGTLSKQRATEQNEKIVCQEAISACRAKITEERRSQYDKENQTVAPFYSALYSVADTLESQYKVKAAHLEERFTYYKAHVLPIWRTLTEQMDSVATKLIQALLETGELPNYPDDVEEAHMQIKSLSKDLEDFKNQVMGNSDERLLNEVLRYGQEQLLSQRRKINFITTDETKNAIRKFRVRVEKVKNKLKRLKNHVGDYLNNDGDVYGRDYRRKCYSMKEALEKCYSKLPDAVKQHPLLNESIERALQPYYNQYNFYAWLRLDKNEHRRPEAVFYEFDQAIPMDEEKRKAFLQNEVIFDLYKSQRRLLFTPPFSVHRIRSRNYPSPTIINAWKARKDAYEKATAHMEKALDERKALLGRPRRISMTGEEFLSKTEGRMPKKTETEKFIAIWKQLDKRIHNIFSGKKLTKKEISWLTKKIPLVFGEIKETNTKFIPPNGCEPTAFCRNPFYQKVALRMMRRIYRICHPDMTRGKRKLVESDVDFTELLSVLDGLADFSTQVDKHVLSYQNHSNEVIREQADRATASILDSYDDDRDTEAQCRKIREGYRQELMKMNERGGMDSDTESEPDDDIASLLENNDEQLGLSVSKNPDSIQTAVEEVMSHMLSAVGEHTKVQPATPPLGNEKIDRSVMGFYRMRAMPAGNNSSSEVSADGLRRSK